MEKKEEMGRGKEDNDRKYGGNYRTRSNLLAK